MVWNPSGLRLGVQEVTRLGMKERQMREIAEFMRRVLIDKDKLERVSEEVKQFRSKYLHVHYCFKKKR
jgi:glycine hydroxymethyltransferase